MESKSNASPAVHQSSGGSKESKPEVSPEVPQSTGSMESKSNALPAVVQSAGSMESKALPGVFLSEQPVPPESTLKLSRTIPRSLLGEVTPIKNPPPLSFPVDIATDSAELPALCLQLPAPDSVMYDEGAVEDVDSADTSMTSIFGDEGDTWMNSESTPHTPIPETVVDVETPMMMTMRSSGSPADRRQMALLRSLILKEQGLDEEE
jgi:hypothetical protein